MAKIKFNKKKHTYKIGKVELISVTTWIKTFFKPFDEKAIAKKMKYINRSKGIHKGIREILKEWKQKREDGTKIHDELYNLINWINDVGEYPKVLSPKSVAGSEFISQFSGDKTLTTELLVFDEKLGLAGTIDLVMADDNVIDLIDWKTNDSIKYKGYDKCTHEVMKNEEDCNFTHYTLQLSTYAYIMEKKGYTINNLQIVHLRDNGYEVIPVKYRKDLVEEMLKWDKRI